MAFDIKAELARIAANPNDSGYQLGGYVDENGATQATAPYSKTGSYFAENNKKAITPLGNGTWAVYDAVQPGKASRLNGTQFQIVDQGGNVVGSNVWKGITDNNSVQQLIGMLSVAIGGPLVGGALAGAAAAGGAGAAAAGGAEAGAIGSTGLGAGSSSLGLTGSLGGVPAGAGYGSMLGAMPAVEAAAAGIPGMATYGGGALAQMGAWSAGAGALGSAASSIPGEAPPSNPYASPEGTPPPSNPMLNSGSGNPLSSMTGDFDWTRLIGPAASLVNGAMGANAASDAADSQLQATREAAALSEPWRQAGTKALNRMQEILGIGGDKTATDYGINAKPFTFTQDDPSYQWRYDQGQKAVESSAANRGGLFSGRAAKELQRFGQGAASQEYQASFNRDQVTKASRLNPLQSMAGQGQTAAQTIGNYTTDGGNAQAAGTVGSSNAWTNAISGALNNYQQNELMNRLLRS